MIATAIENEIRPATLDDLMRVDGKAELISGRIVRMMSTGYLPGKVAGRIFVALSRYAEGTGRGDVFGDNVGYAVTKLRSGRQSFSPDVSFYIGAAPSNPMKFISGPPTFAVEIRSECDYLSDAEIAMAEKRADYFEAGTIVVWDVDILDRCINCYRKAAPYTKIVFRLGETAEAEPAVPGWTIAVETIFK